MKARSKLFVLFVCLVLISLLAASLISINVLSMDMTREIRAHLEDDAANLMKTISTNTFERMADIAFLGGAMNTFLTQSDTDLGRKLDLLGKFMASHGDYSSFAIYNKTGIKIADSRGTGIGENVSNEPFFQKTIRGQIYRDSVPSNYLNSSKEKEILLSGPLYDRSGKINEVLILTYPLKNNVTLPSGTGLQTDMRISLLSNDGQVIYSNYDNTSLPTPRTSSSFIDLPIYSLVKNSNNTVGSAIFKDIESPSRNAIFVFARESSSNRSPDSIENNWVLVASLDTQEAFKEVLNLRNMFILITVIVLAISTFAIYIVVDRTISIPLRKLKHAATEMAEGNLDLIITPPSTVEEIEKLSSQFEEMRARVKTRTQELVKKDKELETANEQLKEKESVLQKANEELKYFDRQKDEFISIASHELRTPIQPILSLSEILRSRIGNSEYNEFLDVIIRNAKRLQHLTEDLLDVTRIESQTLRLNKVKFILTDLVSSVVQEYKHNTDVDKINIELLYNPSEHDDDVIEADGNRIAQVISNLMDNAIKFTKEGGTLSINVQKENNNWITVSVKDTGIGIDPEIMPQLFTKFTSKSVQGIGLGLFISKAVIGAHGGRIWAENNINRIGATFSFSLRLSDEVKETNQYD
jgi:signal transduction histidine kinase